MKLVAKQGRKGEERCGYIPCQCSDGLHAHEMPGPAKTKPEKYEIDLSKPHHKFRTDSKMCALCVYVCIKLYFHLKDQPLFEAWKWQ